MHHHVDVGGDGDNARSSTIPLFQLLNSSSPVTSNKQPYDVIITNSLDDESDCVLWRRFTLPAVATWHVMTVAWHRHLLAESRQGSFGGLSIISSVGPRGGGRALTALSHNRFTGQSARSYSADCCLLPLGLRTRPLAFSLDRGRPFAVYVARTSSDPLDPSLDTLGNPVQPCTPAKEESCSDHRSPTSHKSRGGHETAMNFFSRGSGSKTKAPPDLVRALKDAILRLESSQTGPDQRRKVSLALPLDPVLASWSTHARVVGGPVRLAQTNCPTRVPAAHAKKGTASCVVCTLS